jgi:hypothetical protein
MKKTKKYQNIPESIRNVAHWGHGCTKGGVKLSLYVERTKGWQNFFLHKSV